MPPIDTRTDEFGSLSQLLAAANESHPQIVAARANLRAAQAGILLADASDRPTVALVGRLEWASHFPTSQFLIKQSTLIHDRSVGVEVSVPLFADFDRTFQIRQARAQAVVSEEELRKTELSVSSDLRKSYSAFVAAAQKSHVAAELVTNARLAFEAISERYHSGVGKIVDVLNARSALADAGQQRVKAIAEWLSTRLDLSTSSGRLDLLLLDGAS